MNCLKESHRIPIIILEWKFYSQFVFEHKDSSLFLQMSLETIFEFLLFHDFFIAFKSVTKIKIKLHFQCKKYVLSRMLEFKYISLAKKQKIC